MKNYNKLINTSILYSVLVAFFLISCTKNTDANTAKEEQVFYIANAAEPQSVDPHKVQGVPSHRIYFALFEGLIGEDPRTAAPIPGVAETWDVSEDGTIYTFHLRDSVWSDGVPITADTVVQSWLRVLDPETASPYAWFPSMFVKGANEFNKGEAGREAVQVLALDDKTFQIELIGPLPYVIDALAHYSFAIVPMHVIEEHGDAWIKPENFVSNGPFILTEWRVNDRIVAVKNENYYDAENVALDKVVYFSSEDLDTAYNMYRNGEVDWVVDVNPDKLDALSGNKDFFIAPLLGTYYYDFNNQRAPFDDLRVRRALSLAVDRKTLVEQVTKAGQIAAYSFVPPMEGYDVLISDADLDLEADIARAKELLSEAGFPNGEGFPKTVVLYNTSENHKKVGEFIQAQWKDNLGIDVSLENQEWKTFLESRNTHQHQIARDGWIGDYRDPNTFLDLFLSIVETNNANYGNPKFDAFINQAYLMSGQARLDTLKEAEKVLVQEDQAIMPLYYYSSKSLIDTDKWGGWYPNIMNHHPLRDIYRK